MRFGFFLIFLLTQIIFAQTNVEKLIHGKITVPSGNFEGINIVNLVNNKSTTSDSNGDFYILAKEKDVLVFSSVNLEYHSKIIEKEDLNSDVLILKMTPKVTELKEVVINKYPEINAVSLGISPRGIKKYTPAERRLATASSSRWNPQGLDPLINAISGRNAMLKKELEVEKKERWLVYLETLFEKEYSTNELKIPLEYIKGFHYYCLDDVNIIAILESKNKIKIEFAMVDFARKYNQIILSEKEKE